MFLCLRLCFALLFSVILRVESFYFILLSFLDLLSSAQGLRGHSLCYSASWASGSVAELKAAALLSPMVLGVSGLYQHDWGPVWGWESIGVGPVHTFSDASSISLVPPFQFHFYRVWLVDYEISK